MGQWPDRVGAGNRRDTCPVARSKYPGSEAAMEQPLRRLLEFHQVGERIIKWMEDPRQKCWTVKVFANWVNHKRDLLEKIEDSTGPHCVQGLEVPPMRPNAGMEGGG